MQDIVFIWAGLNGQVDSAQAEVLRLIPHLIEIKNKLVDIGGKHLWRSTIDGTINIRIVEKLPMDKKGYYIYGLAAKNVLVRIIEEENIKIETDTVQKTQKAVKNEKTKSDNKMILYIVLLVGLLFIILFFILILL